MSTASELQGPGSAVTGRRTVVVIGGGPGGSTAAALLAQAGVDVLLLEREVFPRYHIGESLAASCRAIMDLSGALGDVERHGFPVKRGALLRWGHEDWTIDWGQMLGDDVSSWHVDRSEFDDILLRNAATRGAEVVQDATVKRVVFDGERATAVEWSRNAEPDRLLTTEFDFLVDASGRAGVLANRHFRNRHPHEIFRNVAIWGYWDGGERLPETPEGGINVISSPDGWYWVIPLRDDRSSVGFVTHKTNFTKRRGSYTSTEEMLLSLVDESDTVRSLLRDARYQGPARIEQDFSYVTDRFCGPGYFVAGDAACFLDPLLSTGVHLAMYSAMLAAAAIVASAEGDVEEPEARAFYESLYRHAYARLLVLVSGVYEQYRGKKSYFWLAQRLVDPEAMPERLNTAFTELTAGVSDMQDATDRRGWSTRRIVQEEWEAAKRKADAETGGGDRPGLVPFKLEPTDLYDEATGLFLVTTPRLGLRHARAGGHVNRRKRRVRGLSVRDGPNAHTAT